jgi:hypothetical protein
LSDDTPGNTPQTRNAGTRSGNEQCSRRSGRDAATGLSKRAIERKHHVGSRTIVKALVSENPPARKKTNRPSAVLHGLHHHVDAMIQNNPTVTVTEVWERLVDDHDATVSYGAVRGFIAKRLSHPIEVGQVP